MSMRYGDDNNRIRFNAVNQRVRKSKKQTPPNFGLNFRGSKRISAYQSDHEVQFGQKFQTCALLSFVEPNNSLIDFLLSEREEPDVHLLIVFTH